MAGVEATAPSETITLWRIVVCGGGGGGGDDNVT